MTYKICVICELLFDHDTETCPEHGLRLIDPNEAKKKSKKELALAQRHRPEWLPWGEGGRICPECSRVFLDEKRRVCPSDRNMLLKLNWGPDYGLKDRFGDLYYMTPSNMRSHVYAGTDPQDGKRVVIKVAAGSPLRFHRFKQEVEMISALSHPNIVAVRESGEFSDEVPYYIAEFASGPSLEILYRKSRIPLEGMLRLFLSVADAMQHAHERDVYHWDFKPADILIDQVGNPKIFDFGKGKPWLHGDNLRQQATEIGDIFGEPAYVAPEVCRGADVDARANVYSLACMMYACLQQRPPFEGNNWFHTSMMKLQDKVLPLTDDVTQATPPELVTTIMRGLSLEPELRQSSMAELKAELQSLVT